MGSEQKEQEKESATPQGESGEGPALEPGAGLQEGDKAAQEERPDAEDVPGVIGAAEEGAAQESPPAAGSMMGIGHQGSFHPVLPGETIQDAEKRVKRLEKVVPLGKGSRRTTPHGGLQEWDGERWVALSEAGYEAGAAHISELTKQTVYYGVRYSQKAWLAQTPHDPSYCIVHDPSEAFWTENLGHAEHIANDHSGTLVKMTMSITEAD